MFLDLSIFSVFLVAIGYVFLSGPTKAVEFTVLCLSDRVNLVNLVAAVIALNLKYISILSELASLLTPIFIFISAVVICIYNLFKLYGITIKKDEE